MPVQWQSLTYGFRLYYFPRIYNKSLPVYQAFSPDSTHVPVVTDDTYDRIPESHPEYENTVSYRQAPALQALYRIHAPALPVSLARVLPDLKVVPVYSSCPHEHYTTASAFPPHSGKFCKGFPDSS